MFVLHLGPAGQFVVVLDATCCARFRGLCSALSFDSGVRVDSDASSRRSAAYFCYAEFARNAGSIGPNAAHRFTQPASGHCCLLHIRLICCFVYLQNSFALAVLIGTFRFVVAVAVAYVVGLFIL